MPVEVSEPEHVVQWCGRVGGEIVGSIEEGIVVGAVVVYVEE